MGLAVLLASPALPQDAPAGLEWSGFGSVVAGQGNSIRPALRGGYGRQLYGSTDAREASAAALDLEARLGLRWRFDNGFALFVHALARDGAGAAAGRGLGLVEASLDYTRLYDDQDRLRIRLGQFFLPTSREHVEPLWSTPYSIDYSLLNSWIAEEFRPLGADVAYRLALAGERRLEFGASLFCCNDTSAVLLAWRGFARHHRLSVYREELPTAPLFSLAPDGPAFRLQRRQATEPFGPDLDQRAGYAVRSRYEDGPLTLTASWTDNRGDRRLYGDQYAWDSRWLQAGFSYDGFERFTLVGEWLAGKSDMGLRPDPIVDIDFEVAYLLGSYVLGPQWQAGLRLEYFEIDDRDGSIAEDNDEHGHGWTANLAYRPDEHWRWMLEYSRLDATRPGAVVDGWPADQGNHALQLEARFAF